MTTQLGQFPQGVEFFAMTGSTRHLCVLVVEDETLIRWSIAETLAQKGHRVVEASDARGAVRALTWSLSRLMWSCSTTACRIQTISDCSRTSGGES